MRWNTGTSGWTVLALSLSVLFAPTALAVNYVVDDLDGKDDGNDGMSDTGGPNDLPGLDFSDAFKTIGKATSVAVAGDFIFVKDGTYSEAVVPTSRTTLIAVGEVILAKVGGVAFDLTGVGSWTVDGFRIENYDIGVSLVSGARAQLKNLEIRNCNTGLQLNGIINVRRCVITNCIRGVTTTTGTVTTMERCTIVRNVIGLQGRLQPTFRNNIIAFNSIVGIDFQNLDGSLDIDFNDFYDNGADFRNPPDPDFLGPNNISVDPKLVDLSRGIVHLQEDSPLLNGGWELSGGPVTIGAREVGHASAQTLPNGWTDWMDSGGNALELCSISTADVCLEGSGNIILNIGVNRATVISRIYNGSLKSVEFAAVEDLTQPSGMRKVIDADDTTLQRELEFRGSDSGFAPDAMGPMAPMWNPIFEGQVLESSFRFVQVRMTLTTVGK